MRIGLNRYVCAVIVHVEGKLREGWLILTTASVWHVFVKVVELLLSKGSNKEHRNISDYTPLCQSASGGYVNVIKVLLAHGAEINSRFDDISLMALL